MEHEVVVPLPAEVVRQALADRELVAGCVPGLTVVPEESSEERLGGRFRLRIGGSTITYGGHLSRSEGQDDGAPDALRFTADEVRGSGTLVVTVRVTLREEPDGTGTRLALAATVEVSGRLAEADPAVRTAAGRRLLERTATAFAARAGEPAETTEQAGDAGDEAEPEEEPSATVVYLEDHAAERDLDDDLSDLISFSDDDRPTGQGPELPYDPEPVLAGPVRRSIVGRSAEEVDHAPPRGRYAPAAPAHSARARAASRWGGVEPTLLSGSAGERSAIPWVIGGGVALLGGAVVLVRALRRR
ncbi:carbon monoxide dehydrogenase subunit G [Kitasatospora sp. NPDC088346]|uniref:carbon monoxide dehydrogenase subunit G n=1 Tax=Kitasatospora sp. NPDC088346 TaxID=3364073 RepID=UPI0037F9B539